MSSRYVKRLNAVRNMQNAIVYAVVQQCADTAYTEARSWGVDVKVAAAIRDSIKRVKF